jgi:hypothetical protein
MIDFDLRQILRHPPSVHAAQESAGLPTYPYSSISFYNGAGTDCPSQIVTEDRRVRPDANAVADFRFFPEAPVTDRWTAGVEKIVDEHRSMRNEAVVSNHHQLTDERVRLNPASLSNPHSFLDLHKGADKGLVTD